MNQTFQNSAQVLSIGIFFTLMIIGLASTLPHAMSSGLRGARRAARPPRSTSPRCRRSRSCSPPSSATTRSRASSARTRSTGCSASDHAALIGHGFFPHLISGPVPRRPARRVRVRDRRLPGRRRRRRCCAAGATGTARSRATPCATTRGAACTLSGTASRPSACRRRRRPSSSTRSATCPACRRARDRSSTTRRSTGVEADLLLVTHEHRDHNGVEAIGGDPAILRSTAGTLESPVGEVVGVASEHDEVAGTQRGPNTIFVFTLDGVRVAHFGDFGQTRAARRAGGGDRAASTCCSSRSAAARRSAPRRRREIAGRSSARAGSSRCTTARSGSASSSRPTSSSRRYDHVARLDAPSFELERAARTSARSWSCPRRRSRPPDV